VIKKVSCKEEALECNRLLTMLIKYEKEFDPDTNENFVVTDWFENIYYKDDYAIYIALEDNKIVGYTYIKIRELDFTSIKREEAIIDGLYVLEEYRNKKIATNLINEAKKWCKDKNVDTISLNVLADNAIARKLYYKLGFNDFSITLKTRI